jgi:DNA-binding NtrC family response regulator
MPEETKTIQIELGTENVKFQKYSLKVSKGSGSDQGASKIIDRRIIFIGTSPDCQFTLDDPTVSRIHCRIEYDRTGYRIEDLKSKNGTFIEGIRIHEAYLPSKAAIRLGQTELLFKLESETVEVPISKGNQFGKLIGQSLQMREIFGLLARVAPTDATVLIEGESGTGKELAAEAIHDHSPRKDGTFIIFDCSAVPKELIESELFGHVRGAFTGAVRDRAGAFEEANGGTLFIDEVGELIPELQPKLLRALEKREIKPVGSNNRVNINCRIIAATNRNLEKEVRAGNFREDLYYRLAVIKIQMPPLRNRVDDIPVLVHHFLNLPEIKGSRNKLEISYETMEKLKVHPWSGNVRELKNFLERAVILTDTEELEAKFISSEKQDLMVSGSGNISNAADAKDFFASFYNLPFKDAKERLLSKFESDYFGRMLERTKGNITQAAKLSGIHRKSLEYLLKKLDISEKSGIT